METVSTPTEEQAESYTATAALFFVFSHSPKEEKAHLRLPSVWRDLWIELSKSQQECTNAVDCETLRDLRKLIPADIVVPELLSTKTNGHLNTNGDVRRSVDSIENANGSHQTIGRSEELIGLWSTKASTISFKKMLRLRQTLPIFEYKDELLHAIEENQTVIICGETGISLSLSFHEDHRVYTDIPRMWKKYASTIFHS